jgi:aminoglycoside phosphotransferase (APT) family kinase protein
MSVDPVVDEHLARRLVDAQFPRWADLPLRPVTAQGWDNRTFRLGDALIVRLPSAARYAAQVEKEQRWLPVLAPQLSLPVPTPVAQGVPGLGYPYPWSVLRWIAGEPAASARIGDRTGFATDLATFLVALRRADPAGGPAPGPHNFHRGGALTVYAEETLRAVDTLGTAIPHDAVLAVWADALATRWDRDPVWVHGDVAAGNLLVRDGRLAAVIDFGSSGVGDPACDVVIAWTLLHGRSRAAFVIALGLDAATRARGRGWALWKALITLVDAPDDPEPRRVLDEILADHARGH